MCKVSVVLPFYNAESTLARAIESIQKQEMSDFELLLVDNNSSDDSKKVALSFVSDDSRIQLMEAAEQGVMHAFNCGLEKAQGRYIARMDADDVALPNRLKSQADWLDDHPETGLVAGLVRYEAHRKGTKGFQKYVNWVNSLVNWEAIQTSLFVESPIVNPTVMARKSLFDELGSYRDGDFPEDYELLLRWAGKGVKMEKVPEEVLIWYDSDTRLTRTDSRYTDDAFYRVKAAYLAKWLRDNNRYHPKVWVWGAGKRSRKRVAMLENHQVTVEGYIDIVPEKTTLAACIYFEDLPDPGNLFVVSYVGNRGIRDKIRAFLVDRGYREGIDFILAA
ncbi:glycosyltransferase family 2 protein [Limibacter armeniacum]|uniref:glycosyltransferase family 2 protein n=1 Tax=Limibacter armeniacum TaxID=466084 RepID=UPI002FE56C47